MANQRKQIIINEIAFWKKNKLLPEHYCDFLLTLYTEGESDHKEMIGNAKHSVKAQEKRKGKWMYIAIPCLALLLFALLFIIETVWIVSIPAVLLGLASIIGAFYYAKKNELLAPILYISGALILFGLSVKLSLAYFPENNTALYSVLLGNCAFWLLSGISMRLVYFIVSGLLGMVAIVIYMVVNG